MAGEQVDPAKAAGEATAAALKPSFDAILDSLAGIVKPAPAAAPAPAAEKIWTRSELDAQVAGGKITQDAADRLLEDQQARRIAGMVTQSVAETQKVQTVGQKVDRYIAANPDLKNKSSEAFNRVAREYKALVEESGLPESQGTQLAALRAVFGPIDAIEAAAGNPGRRETHQEGAGGSGGGDNNAATDWTKGMTPREIAHYQKCITAGIYTEASAAAEKQRAVARQPRA